MIVQVTNDALTTIFGTILGWHLDTGSFSADVKNLSSNIIAATLSIYSQAVASLLPTPAKSHYTFNLRDFARVIQVGISTVASSIWAPYAARECFVSTQQCSTYWPCSI